MAKPILLAIDDDTSVLEAVVQDLRRHYGQFYRIVRAASGAAALDICRQLKERGETVALFLSDQRMPGMTGVDFLQQALTIYPDAKRVLLTAYADTEAAIRAINSAKIHYYLNKPWDPPEEKLYPVLDDLLEAWKQGYKAPFEGIRIVGLRWSATDHAMRDFLTRNRIPYQWLNPELTPDALDVTAAERHRRREAAGGAVRRWHSAGTADDDGVGGEGRSTDAGPAGVLRRGGGRRGAGRTGGGRLWRVGGAEDADRRGFGSGWTGRVQLQD